MCCDVLVLHGKPNPGEAESPRVVFCRSDELGADPLALRRGFQSIHLGELADEIPDLCVLGSVEHRHTTAGLIPSPCDEIHGFPTVLYLRPFLMMCPTASVRPGHQLSEVAAMDPSDGYAHVPNNAGSPAVEASATS